MTQPGYDFITMPVTENRGREADVFRPPGCDSMKASPAMDDGEKLMDQGHPILVRVPPAEREISVKMLKYFGSRSKSGGGECDVTRVDGQTYCVVFQDEGDQRRVLGRGNHVIEFTVSVTVQGIGTGDLDKIRQLSNDGERLKMLQQLGAIAEISQSNDIRRKTPVDVRPINILKSSQTSDNQAKVSLTSTLYEYIMEIYAAEMDNLMQTYKVKIKASFGSEGFAYVRFIPQGSESLPEKAKETFTVKVQTVMGDWSQEKVDLSVVHLTFSDIKQRVKDRWSNILVIQEGETGIILRGPKDDLSQAVEFFKKGNFKSARPRREVTISTRDMRTEIPVDVRHMDILRKLKSREISDIERKYNVRIEERKKNDSVLVTFKATNTPPDLSPHACQSFITLLQKTVFNIQRKEVNVESEFLDQRVSILQEQLTMGGVDIVMEYSKGTVVLIGHPAHIAFAEEKLNNSQNPGKGHTAAASEEPMDTSTSSVDKQKEEEADKCPICLCEIEDKAIIDKCKHAYCRDCLKNLTASKPVCAICGVSYGVVKGDQPEGTMIDRTTRYNLPGYPTCGTIEIHYNIPSGTQKDNHPHPGRHFSGTSRTAYLPDNAEGRDILRLLKKAFDQRLIFTVGESRTTGATDTVTWNDIHHKTNATGGPQSFGYPDPDYLKRVRDELKAKGIE